MTKRRYLIPAAETRAEIRVSNSRFIATAAPVFSVAEAQAFVKRIKEEFAGASHNVPAYLVGYGPAVTAHSSDDGEPSGTAGRPALAVLQGSGLGDIAVVVTRYFGGTRLGTGGLVRAYGDAVKAVLQDLPLAEKVSTLTALLAVPYALFEQAKLLIEANGGCVLDEDFAADVTITVRIVEDRFAEFQAALSELSNGQIEAQVVETNPETIMPLAGGAAHGLPPSVNPGREPP